MKEKIKKIIPVLYIIILVFSAIFVKENANYSPSTKTSVVISMVIYLVMIPGIITLILNKIKHKKNIFWRYLFNSFIFSFLILILIAIINLIKVIIWSPIIDPLV
jgi:hypothetical protein